ncbi:kinase-like domain-containing protein [Armillaria mellea]|nr:kinase-like domain-containing protein [Armillaria mellea]
MLGRSWAHIKLDDELVEREARAQIRNQVWSLIRDLPSPWSSVGLTPQLAETVVMDVLQQEMDDPRHPDGYRTAYRKCLQALCKARNVVPSSLLIRDLTREGDNPIASGGFADIWQGHLHDTQVCLKVLRVFGTEEQKARVLRGFCQEALVWRQLRHPNVLPFLGVNKELFTPRYCLVSPWMVNGNIMSYLEAHPDHDRLISLVQIAEGMKYLQSQSSDSSCRHTRGAFTANILVTNDLSCCLADFGLSLFVESQALASSSRMSKGSVRWLAPEYFHPDVIIDRAYITARDVYAYGCTIVEIITGEPPFGYIKNDAAIMLAVITGRRPLRPQHILLEDGLWSLVTMCLRKSPSQRPTAEQISNVLTDRNFLAGSWKDGWISSTGATTVTQNHSSPTQTDVLSGSGPQTPASPPADFSHNNMMPTLLFNPIPSSQPFSSIRRPGIGSRIIDFKDFNSRRHPPTIRSKLRQPLEIIPWQSPSPEPTAHVTERDSSSWIAAAPSTRRFYTLPRRSTPRASSPAETRPPPFKLKL